MITELFVRNYVLISELKLTFRQGMAVITGETGAGKSIIVGALNLIFGKSSPQNVAYRPELDVYLEITFNFDKENTELFDFLEETGIDTGSGELIIAREITASGKASSYLNGRKTSISVLKDLHDYLIDFHHQRDQQKLLVPANQLDLLDQYGKLMPLRQEFKQMLSNYKFEIKTLNELEAEDERSRQLLELYRFQLDELSSLMLYPGEDVELQQEFELLSHSEEIINLTHSLYESLYESENSIYDSLNQAYAGLIRYTDLSTEIEDICNRFNTTVDMVQEISKQLRTLNDKVASDPVRLNEIKNRLDLINSLKTKYKLSTIAELAEYQNRILQYINSRETNQEAILLLRKSIEDNFVKLIKQADLLTENRRIAALALRNDIETGIRQLAIPYAKLEIQIDKKAHGKIIMSDVEKFFTDTGQDNIEFLFSANPGSPVLPLKSIVSGGELSRILLAAKKALSDVMPPRTIILDEIDTGIGGKTAGSMAVFIQALASRHQVICITHLAKIAAIADTHFSIEKIARDEDTEIAVDQLSSEKRISEIARMLSGQITDLSLKHAKELLQ